MAIAEFTETAVPGLEWPGGATLACLLTFDYQGEAGLPTEQRGLRPDVKVVKEHIYEPRVGIWRVLDTLDRFGVKATFPTCGRSVELYPGSCREIRSRGHELAAHGWDHEMLNQLSVDEEAAVIDRTLASFESVLGYRPVGWRSPYYLVTHDTTDLLVDRGFAWQSDFHDDDVPYILERDDGSIVEIPVQIDDWPRYWSDVGVYPQAVRGNPRDVMSVLTDAFDVLYRESQTHSKLYCVTLHPQIVGRPDRLIILEGLLEHATRHPGVWFPTCSEVADLVRATSNLGSALARDPADDGPVV